MSNLNKKIRKVQKGGVWSTFTGGLDTAMSKASDGVGMFKGAADELKASSKLGEMGKKLESIAEDDQTEEKLNSLKSSKFADSIIWDLFWEEPCYIDPGSGHIVLSKIKSLWCTFQSQELKDLLTPPTKETVKIADINKCKEEYLKNTFGKSADEIKQDVTAHRQFNALIKKIQDGTVRADPSETPPADETPYDKSIRTLKQFCPDSIETTDLTKNMDTTNLLFNPPSAADPEDTGGECNPIKWVFCFIFKFILGPGGFFVIKMLPHIIKFYFAVKESFARIFTGFGNSLRGTGLSYFLGSEQKKFVYYGKIGEKENGESKYGFVKDYFPGFFDTIWSYLGTVIPYHYIKYDWGQKYGKGDFGKLIVGLVIVSAVIIIIGGVGVTMLFLCFAFYCMKTLSMFSDNIKEKGKGKA